MVDPAQAYDGLDWVEWHLAQLDGCHGNLLSTFVPTKRPTLEATKPHQRTPQLDCPVSTDYDDMVMPVAQED